MKSEIQEAEVSSRGEWLAPGRWTNFLLEAGLVIAWSSGYIGAKIASAAGSVLLILFWRFLLVAILLTPVWLREVRNSGTRPLLINVVLGFFAMAINIGCGVVAIDKGIPAGTLAIIYSLQPLATAAIAGPVLGEVVTRLQWAGLLFAFAGVSIASGFDGSHAPTFAYILAILGMVGLVIAMLIAKAFPISTPMLPSIGIQSGVTAVTLLPLLLMEGRIVPPLADPMFLFALGWYMLLSTLCGYYCFWMCLRRFSATRVGTILYLTPPFTMLCAWFAFDEPITSAKLGGLVIGFVGVLIALKPPRIIEQAVRADR